MKDFPQILRVKDNPAHLPPVKRGPGQGRPKGIPNKITADLRQAIIEAASNAGGGGGYAGVVAYLTQQAHDNPGPFMGLLARTFPPVKADPGSGGGAYPQITVRIIDPDGGDA